jgi:AcrR family transcriptional regulator
MFMARLSKASPDPKIAAAVAAHPSRAQRTRENTRAKLIEAAERMIAGKGVEGTTISDITNAADVATGSFYNHFTSKTEIAEAVFAARANVLVRINDQIFLREPDPAQAIAYIQKVFLTRAVADPIWGWFVVHATSDLPQMSHAFSPAATAHIQRGIEAGRFILVSLIAGMRDMLEGQTGRDRPARIVQSLLQMLGMPIDEARALADKRLPPYVGRIFQGTGPF